MDIQSPQADSPNTAEDLPSHRDQLIAYYESQIARYTVCLQTLQEHHVPGASPMEIVPENAAMNGDETVCPSDVTDAQWERIEPLLPPLIGHGRPRANRRRTLNGIVYVLTTQCAWRAMPRRYGSYVTCWRRLLHWQQQGTWQHILQVLTIPTTIATTPCHEMRAGANQKERPE